MGMSKADFNKAVASAWAHVEWLGFDHWKAIRSITKTNAEAMRIEKSKGLIYEGGPRNLGGRVPAAQGRGAQGWMGQRRADEGVARGRMGRTAGGRAATV